MSRTAALRALSVVSLAWGAALLAVPRTVTGALAPEYPPAKDWVVRVLGARLVVQHAVLLAAEERPLVLAGVAVDGLHAASMLAFLGMPRYRRAALISAVTTAAPGAATAALAGRTTAD